MNIKYDELLRVYGCQFEGIPKPVFYKELFPTSFLGTEMDDYWDKYNFVRGLKYKSGIDNKYENHNKEKYEENKALYLSTLKDFIEKILCDNEKAKIGIITIPSSKKGMINQVTSLVREYVSINKSPNIDDLTLKFNRTKDKDVAHETGHRDPLSNMETLLFDSDINLNEYDIILVIDDVVTSGNSFIAVNTIIDEMKFIGEIINFAFSRSMNKMSIDYYEAEFPSSSIKNDERKISGIIFDFDQTLIDDQKRHKEFESRVREVSLQLINNWKFIRENNYVYNPYNGVYELQTKRIPFAIVSNSYDRRVLVMFQLFGILRTIYQDSYNCIQKEPSELKNNEVLWHKKYQSTISFKDDGKANRFFFERPKNFFVTPIEEKEYESEKSKVRYAKPHPKGVLEAKKWVIENFNLNNNSRIIGVGNTYEDIKAYRAAGLETILGLWGVPQILHEEAKRSWGADHYFETFKDFNNWVEKEGFDTYDITQEESLNN